MQMDSFTMDSQWPIEYSETSWLPLADYSMKYRISMSTLRRRIRNSEVSYKLEDGKYLLPDLVWSKVQRTSIEPSIQKTSPPQKVLSEKMEEKRSEVPKEREFGMESMLSEIKKAYTQSLQDKEEIILMLREEISDLRTLVRVLESENARLSNTELEDN